MDHSASPAVRQLASGPATRFECKVCWAVYDPALGDEVWQIPPGTPFSALPPHWSCPNCAAEKQGFLILDERV
jgi:hydrogenase-1 operon protein HyaF